MHSGWMRLVAGLLLAMLSLGAAAQTRAWLDRDRIRAGETVTLNIETVGTANVDPDYTPLQADFELSGRTSRREFQIVNGRNRMRTLFAVALRPLREGSLTVPALRVGSERTAPLSLQVEPGTAATPARAGDDVFIESEVDDPDPYVQQAVGWVVRLYSAVPLVSGQLDQPAPDGAALQRVGDDAQYSRDLGGRRYQVVERRFLLVPERSGPLTIPGARFEGRGTGGFFDDLFGDRGGALQAQAAPRTLQVRPIPANAPQPWLPLQGLTLRYQSTPQELRAGSAVGLVVEAVADGATAAQLPDLELPPIDGVQVFAEPAQTDERFVDGRPRVKLTRRFSLVPSRAGPVRLDGLRLPWWDVRAGLARTASLPPLTWQASAGTASPPVTGNPLPAPPADAVAPTTGGAARAFAVHRGWILATLLFAALWLFTLVWGLHRGGTAPATAVATAAAPGGYDRTSLKRALDTGDLGEVAEALCAMARPPARSVDELSARLDDAEQREALQSLQRARWAGGDAAARARLRKAFAGGPRWRASAPPDDGPLPPLYPPG